MTKSTHILLLFFCLLITITVSVTFVSVNANSPKQDPELFDYTQSDEYKSMLRFIYLDAANAYWQYLPTFELPSLSFEGLYDNSYIHAPETGIMTDDDELASRFGTPVEMTYGKALNGANPRYKTEQDINGLYSENCQRAAAAYELRRRGYDVEAKPYDSDKSYSVVDYAFKNNKEYIISNLPKSGKTVIENFLLSWGDGSRVKIVVYWQNGGSHAFIGENVGGKIIFLDPQTRKLNVDGYFNYVIPEKTSIIRTDNALFTKTIYTAVTGVKRAAAGESKWSSNYEEKDIVLLGDYIISQTVYRN